MAKSIREIKMMLNNLKKQCENGLPTAKDIISSLKDPEASKAVEAPYHLSMLLNKYVEMVEARLIPALGALPPVPQEEEPEPQAVESSPPISQPLDSAGSNPVMEVAGELDTSPSLKISTTEPDTGGGTRRSIPRYNQRLTVRYSVPGRDKTPHKAYSRDVGAMGLFIMATRLEKTGQPLNIEVDLPEKGAVKMQGTVVWTKWVPPALRASEYPGFAVKIHSAPESWFSYFMAVEEAHGHE